MDSQQLATGDNPSVYALWYFACWNQFAIAMHGETSVVALVAGVMNVINSVLNDCHALHSRQNIRGCRSSA